MMSWTPWEYPAEEFWELGMGGELYVPYNKTKRLFLYSLLILQRSHNYWDFVTQLILHIFCFKKNQLKV